MSLTANVGRQLSNQLFKHKVYLYSGVKCYSIDKSRTPWNHLWIPEKYKKEEHARHAEKYHMHPDEYQPYEPLERSTGDYPKLPNIGPAAKDPFYPYDRPLYKKSYHEPIHHNFEIMSEDRYDFGSKFLISPARGALIFLASMGFFIGMFYVASPYPIMLQPSMAKQYPYEDKVHYTFEPRN